MTDFTVGDMLTAFSASATPSRDTLNRLAGAGNPARASYADRSCEIILQRIRNFEDGLDQEHEVAIMLASFGQSVTLTVTAIEYSNPSTLVFHGYIDGQPATLIQHISQLNFLLRSVKRTGLDKPKRRIGFGQTDED